MNVTFKTEPHEGVEITWSINYSENYNGERAMDGEASVIGLCFDPYGESIFVKVQPYSILDWLYTDKYEPSWDTLMDKILED